MNGGTIAAGECATEGQREASFILDILDILDRIFAAFCSGANRQRLF